MNFARLSAEHGIKSTTKTITVGSILPKPQASYKQNIRQSPAQLFIDHAQRLNGELEEYVDYLDWLTTMFPRTFTGPMATFHHEFWQHIFSIEEGVRPRPFVAIWPRGFSKTTNLECASIALAVLQAQRRYWLSVRSTQDSAEKYLTNLSKRLGQPEIAYHYPELSQKEISKDGNQAAWNRNRLYTAYGIVYDAIWTKGERRGAKVGDYRPDVISLDDIDETHDSLVTIERKISLVTESLLPSGSSHAAGIGVQNLPNEHGIFRRLANESEYEVDFWQDRIVSGPHKAVNNPVFTKVWDDVTEQYQEILTDGEATWSEVKPIEVLNDEIKEYGKKSFLKEKQHEFDVHGDLFADHEFERISVEEFNSYSVYNTIVSVDPAVTNTDKSDNQGVVCVSKVSKRFYPIDAWEGRLDVKDVIQKAILMAVKRDATAILFETNQGGDTWELSYKLVWKEMVKEGFKIPKKPLKYLEIKVNKSHGSKIERQGKLHTHYELGKVVHLNNAAAETVEKSLRRLPHPPDDLPDGLYNAILKLSKKRNTRHLHTTSRSTTL